MKRMMMAVLVGMLAVGLAGTAWAEEQKQEQPKQEEAATTEKPAENADQTATQMTDLKAEMPTALYNSTIKPIEDALAKAEKLQAVYDKEMEKPAEKRNQALLMQTKANIAIMYESAMLKAKAAAAKLTKEEWKQAVTQQYETPAKQKAITTYMELATMAREKNDFRDALAMYRKILNLDPENADAKFQIEQLEKEMQAAADAAKKGTGSGSSGGGSEDNNAVRRGLDPAEKFRNPGGIRK